MVGMVSKGLVTKLPNKPAFVISVDTELVWGFIQHPKRSVPALFQNNPERARSAINTLLQLFENYDIKATWAVVGHLFLTPGEEKDLVSSDIPQLAEGWVPRDFYQSLNYTSLFYCRDIVERIISNPVKHEIGLHGFFHIPFDQCSRDVARAELELGMKAANKLGINPKSYVFPHNEVGHIDVLKENSIQIYRGEDIRRWWDRDRNFIIRTFDSVVHEIIASPTSPSYHHGIWETPSSTGLYDPKLPFTIVPRVKLGINRAIRKNKVFHVWLHPWNLLLSENLEEDLRKIFEFVACKRDEGKLDVMTMGELSTHLNGQVRVE